MHRLLSHSEAALSYSTAKNKHKPWFQKMCSSAKSAPPSTEKDPSKKKKEPKQTKKPILPKQKLKIKTKQKKSHQKTKKYTQE